jgi:hypothetical protein
MKIISVLIILVHLTLSSISQIASDSVTCLPNSKLRKAIKQIEDCKIVKEELVATQGTVSILQDKVELRNKIIESYEVKDSLSEARILNLQSIISMKEKQILNEKSIEAIQNIKIKTFKVNKWLYTGGGLIVGILVRSLLK